MGEMNNNLIGGVWREADDVSENTNPSDVTDLIGLYARGGAQDVTDAAEAAEVAMPAWAGATPQLRADLLDRVAAEITRREDEIATMLACEEGKVLLEALGEVRRAAHVFRFFAGEALRLTGDALASVRPGVDVEVTREPLGIVGIITPWNFPIAIPAWKIAPALAYGNCVIFKPAEQTPGSAHILTQIIHEAGCPAGVFNLVMGRGSVVGEAMTTDPRISGISFTGSVQVGRQLAGACAANMKKLQLEMGGKNPVIVMDDADLETAVSVCLNGAFYQTGQRCTASSRLIVQSGIHDAFIAELSRQMQALKVGHALAEGMQIGPVAARSQLESNLYYVALAAEEGCDVLGGEQLTRDTEGYFQAPALFLGASNAMRSAREEIFGPCASVIRVDDFEEAVALANDTQFGLSSGICTTNLRYAREFKRRSAAGMVMLNLPTAGVDYHVPFGGRKASSFGSREQGSYAAEFYTSVKTAYTYAG
ncbi:aldehyde dehydrogenase family protein [Vreelandella boliviensis]|uniref:Aldehyde dehydrogenase family protein n=1 Tax=Vreelandella boliviensis LC1 TaxID=1072583 RepID=A0A265E1S7_9GAMM|nr:aldehyde dehydrogenase family protein [Halomonas boliviensis]EHJ94683.1 putative aldehyde dehydrogenase ycbD [Halomonas boliviensis LC1]OZT75480.1 aldehyde dehydrogenase family protein [Halomonas boliviensis LC1]